MLSFGIMLFVVVWLTYVWLVWMRAARLGLQVMELAFHLHPRMANTMRVWRRERSYQEPDPWLEVS